MNDIQLSAHFTVAEFCHLQKYPDNIPTIQQIANMAYGCRLLLEPTRKAIGCPIIINSGFRISRVNKHLRTDRPATHRQRMAPHLVDALRHSPPLRPHRVL